MLYDDNYMHMHFEEKSHEVWANWVVFFSYMLQHLWYMLDMYPISDHMQKCLIWKHWIHKDIKKNLICEKQQIKAES